MSTRVVLAKTLGDHRCFVKILGDKLNEIEIETLLFNKIHFMYFTEIASLGIFTLWLNKFI